MALNPDQHRLSDEWHQAIFDQRIEPELFVGAKSVSRPVAVILGGQPGAGKSAAVDLAVRELAPRGGSVQIIGDDLRAYHPAYARLMERDDKTAAFYTDRDTGRWVEKAIDHAKSQRINLVIEGTMRDGDKVATTMENLRAAGYVIDARALAVNPRLSEQGIQERYEGQRADRGVGRMTTPEAHRAGYEGMPVTVERIERDKLADRVTIYRRPAEVIYSNELQAGQWVREPAARAAVEAERARPMTLQERKAYALGFDRLAEQLAKPERQASGEEVRALDAQRRQAKALLAAEVFRQVPPERAVRQHPELATAYECIRTLEVEAKASGMNPQQQTAAMAYVRERVAERIERGDVPQGIEWQALRATMPEPPRDLER